MPATFDPGTIRTLPRPQVYMKVDWSDVWQAQPDIICTSLSHELFAVGKATFRYHHGCMIPRGGQTQRKVYRQDFRDLWVKVVYTPEDGSGEQYWWGVVTSQQRSMLGAQTGIAAGDVEITAHGIEYLLTRVQITRSIIEGGEYIEQGLMFNHRISSVTDKEKFQANKAPDALEFSTDYSTAVAWTARDILLYLMSQVRTTIYNDGPFLSSVAALVSNEYVPVAIPTHGRTVYDIFNDVIDRRRGLTWFFDPFLDGDEPISFELKVKQINSVDIDLPDSVTLAANDEKITLDIASARDVVDAVETADYMTRYHTVVVEGAPLGTVYTATLYDYGGSLEPNWTTDQQNRYEAAASGMSGYGLLDISEAKTWNDKARLSDELRNVFTNYRANRGLGDINLGKTLFPVLGEWDAPPSSSSDASQVIHYPSMRFESYIPLIEGVDYSSSSTHPPSNNHDDAQPKYRRPFPIGITRDSKIVDLSNAEVSGGLDETQGDGGLKISCSIQVSDTEWALSIIPNGMPHVLTNGDYSLGASPAVSHTEQGYLGAGSNLAVTVYARATNNIRITYPQWVTQPTTANQSQTLYIRLGEDARLDWLVSGTIVEVEGSGNMKTSPVDRVLRDDRPKMETIARLAWEWYRRPRKSLSLRWRQIVPYDTIRIGKLIERLSWSTVSASDAGDLETLDGIALVTLGDEEVLTILGGTPGFTESSEDSWMTLGGEPFSLLGADDEIAILGEAINTIISSVVYDFERGETSLQTQFGEIDFELLGTR